MQHPAPVSPLTAIICFALAIIIVWIFVKWAVWQHKRDVAKYERARRKEVNRLLDIDQVDWNRSSQ